MSLKDDNWYVQLLEIDESTPIISVAVGGELYPSLESAKLVLDVDFDGGYGLSEGQPFTAWTNDRVYFPGLYDGAEWIDSVPRNPCNEATKHVGGQ